MAAKNSTPYLHKFEADGTEKALKVKSFGRVPAGLLRKHRHDPEEGMWQIIEWGVESEKDLAVFDEMPMDQVEDFFQAWQKAGEVTAGESSSSSE